MREHPVTDEDIVLEIAAVASRESLLQEFEEIENDPNAGDISSEGAESLHSSVMHGFSQYRKRQARKRALRRGIGRAACLVLLLIFASFAAMRVDAARIAVANYMIKTFPQFSEIHYDAHSNALPPLGWQLPYYPTWLPEGTRVVRLQTEDANNYYIWYMDRDGYEFHFAVFPAANQPYAYDTENMEQEEISVNGITAIFAYDRQRNIHTLILPMAENVIMIRGKLSEYDIKTIAEKIHM